MQRKLILAASAVVAVLVLAYSNYFLTGFHFADYPAIRDNVAIRSLHNIPRFFADISTSSTDPADYAFRPVVTTSFAIDSVMGGGPRPVIFHVSEFLVFLGGLALIAWFFYLIFEQTISHPWNSYLAILGAALFGVHPAVAELLNAISQRGEMIAAFGVVGGVALYGAFPAKRRFGFYLLPPLVGILANPAGLIFGPMLLLYILLVEPPPPYETEKFTADQLKSRDQTQAPVETAETGKRIRIRRRKHPMRKYLKAQLARFLPALTFTAAAAIWEWLAMPAQAASRESLISYWFTQPWVAWHYFAAAFSPFHLGPSSDLTVFGTYDLRAVLGLVFVLGVISFALLIAVSQLWRPTAFGLWWFILGILPGAALVRPDVERDTRMFLPFIGLALAITWTFRMLLPGGEPLRRLEAIVAGMFIIALAYGTHARNTVWGDEVALWRDDVAKYPKSVPALENYALAVAEAGKPADAYEILRQARRLNPTSADVEANLGAVTSMLNQNDEARQHFGFAMRLGADRPSIHYLQGVWLEKTGHNEQAVEAYSWASSLSPLDLRPRFGLLRCLGKIQDWYNLRKVLEETRAVVPGDPGLVSFDTLLKNHPDTVKAAEELVRDHPTAENYGQLSRNYCWAGEYDKCLQAAQKSVELSPNYAEGYNFVGAAYRSLGRLDEAIDAVSKAVQMDPDNQRARENLSEWQMQKLDTTNTIAR
ncbi:MAG TPA: tetratricopeptide repeat protein [Bryobacteraceae bacterium]|jgi:tetratricopeptide (TPR) repeat protein